MAQPGGGDVLVLVPEVQLHKVEGGVEALLEWGSFRVILVGAGDAARLVAQVGRTEWVLDMALPVLKATPQTYMFAIPGSQVFYSLLFARGTPPETVTVFEAILEECTAFQVSGAISKETAEGLVDEVTQAVLDESERISGPVPASSAVTPAGAFSGAAVAAPQPASSVAQPSGRATTPERIMQGAAKAGGMIAAAGAWASARIMSGSQSLMQRTTPRTEPLSISPETKARIKAARSVAGRGAALAGSVATGVADLSIRVAQGIVKRMSATEYGKHLTTSQSQRTAAAREIAAASVVAAAQIYESMEQAAQLVLRSGGEATSQFVTHRYGADAGEVSRDAAAAAVDVGMMQYSMSKMGIRRVARRIAKHTAAGMIKNITLGPDANGATAASGGMAGGASAPASSGRSSMEGRRTSMDARRPPARIAQQS